MTPSRILSEVQGKGMNVVSLFAGIGGFELGLERAGMNVVAQCEISAKCRHLLATHWPGVQQFGDIREMRAADVPQRVHVICGGFPCQDISFAGKGAGLAGERSGLWSEYARLIGEFRPDYVIVENVAALLGRGLGDVLGDLAALGYDAWWDCIPAAAVGAPHRRDRLWIIAYPRSQQHEGYGDALRRAVASELSCAVTTAADVAYAESVGRWPGLRIDDSRGGGRPLTGNGGRSLADTQSERRSQARVDRPDQPPQWAERSGGTVSGIWLAEPDVGRVAHGVPARVDRLHGLGNAVVPQIPEIIGRAIIAARLTLTHKAA